MKAKTKLSSERRRSEEDEAVESAEACRAAAACRMWRRAARSSFLCRKRHHNPSAAASVHNPQPNSWTASTLVQNEAKKPEHVSEQQQLFTPIWGSKVHQIYFCWLKSLNMWSQEGWAGFPDCDRLRSMIIRGWNLLYSSFLKFQLEIIRKNQSWQWGQMEIRVISSKIQSYVGNISAPESADICIISVYRSDI